ACRRFHRSLGAGLRQFGFYLPQVRGGQVAGINQTEHQTLRRAAEKTLQEVRQQVTRRFRARDERPVAMRLLLGDMSDQPGFLHVLEEPQYSRVRQGLTARQAAEQVANRQRAMLPEQPEHFKLAVRQSESLASSHHHIPAGLRFYSTY